MSVDYRVRVVYGVRFNMKEHRARTKNITFNPSAPYCPKTGKRIPEYIETGVLLEDIEEIASSIGLMVCSDTDCQNYFIGAMSEPIDLNEVSFVSLFDNVIGIKDLTELIHIFCAESGISSKTLNFYAVGNVG